MFVRSGNLSLEIWSSGILMEPVAPGQAGCDIGGLEQRALGW
jgi:hypothetical protein